MMISNNNNADTVLPTTRRRAYRNDPITGVLRLQLRLIFVLFLVLLHHICTVNGQELLDQTATTMKDDNTTTIISDDNSSNNISSNTESTRMDNIIVIPISPTATPSDYILFPWFVELLGCWSLFLLTRFNVPIPYAAVMVSNTSTPFNCSVHTDFCLHSHYYYCLCIYHYTCTLIFLTHHPCFPPFPFFIIAFFFKTTSLLSVR